MNQLVLNNLHDRHPALTEAIAATYKEAAEVCLNRFHKPPTKVTLSDNGRVAVAEIFWTRPTPRALAAWANETDATEAGAYGCVIAGLEVTRAPSSRFDEQKREPEQTTTSG